MTETELKLHIRNGLRIFLDSLRGYEGESQHPLYLDERDSLEFVDIFLESSDSFVFTKIGQTFKKPANYICTEILNLSTDTKD